MFGYLHDDITFKRPTIGLAADVLSNLFGSGIPVLRYLLQDNKLLRFRMLKFIEAGDNGISLTSKTLKMDDRILKYLFEIDDIDALISPFSTLRIPENNNSDSKISAQGIVNVQAIIQNHIEKGAEGKRLYINLNGNKELNKKETAQGLCAQAGVGLLIIDLSEAVKSENPFEDIIFRTFREGILQQAAIYFENTESLLVEDDKCCTLKKIFFKIADELSWITFFDGDFNQMAKEEVLNRNIFINIEVTVPNCSVRKIIWKDLLDKEGILIEEAELNSIANKFRFTESQVRDVIHSFKNIIYAKNESAGKEVIEYLHDACRLQSNHKLVSLAQRVLSTNTWSDIVLPKDRLEQLKEISNYIKYKDVVYEEWGFDKKLSLGKGLNILFSGTSGTGKTMAAGVIANDLGLELYKIDLSSVVSKYIGETEKNLSKIFKEAETGNAILFFDEADALFGKRSETKDAHDRYANIEVSYLLQKLEEHEGIVILATNLSRNIDEAFQRRMHFIVEFLFPDELQRREIWEKIFPEVAPLNKGINFELIANNFRLTGGSIKNIALHSAFLAAVNGKQIKDHHIAAAIKREYQKMGCFLPEDIMFMENPEDSI